MALSDCVKCFETPCVCGYGYKDYSLEKKLSIVSAIMGSEYVAMKKKAPDDVPGFNEFDETLFDLCRKDDYAGLYAEFIKRYAYGKA